MIVVNAMGKPCPKPVAMTKAALDKGAEELEVLVDNPEAATNVKRLLEDRGFRVLLQDDDGRLKLTAGHAAAHQIALEAGIAQAVQHLQGLPVEQLLADRVLAFRDNGRRRGGCRFCFGHCVCWPMLAGHA